MDQSETRWTFNKTNKVYAYIKTLHPSLYTYDACANLLSRWLALSGGGSETNRQDIKSSIRDFINYTPNIYELCDRCVSILIQKLMIY